MEATLTVVRIVILVLLVAIIALCGMAWWKRPFNRLWIIPPFSWSVFVMALYIAVLYGDISSRMFSVWAGALWLCTCLLVLGGVWLFLWPARKR